MINIDKIVAPSPAQWEMAVRGMRNSFNSWDKSDSYITHIEDRATLGTADYQFCLGDADMSLMQTLIRRGESHRKFLRMLPVVMDISAPLSVWKQLDTYKVGTVANSCSTMHKVMEKEFTSDMFSMEDVHTIAGLSSRDQTICALNTLRTLYLNGGKASVVNPINHSISAIEYAPKSPDIWRELIQLLPDSYIQKRTWFANYEVLLKIYFERRNHKMPEWHVFCKEIERLPRMETFIEALERHNEREE